MCQNILSGQSLISLTNDLNQMLSFLLQIFVCASKYYTIWKYWHNLPPRLFFGLGVLEHFGLKKETREIVKIYKDFEL